MINNPDAPQKLKLFLRTMPMIYVMLLIGQVLFVAVTCYIARNPVLNLKPVNDIYFYVVPLFALATGIIGAFLYNKRMADIGNLATIQEKIAAYQTALIIRYALTEGSTLFAIVTFLLTENYYYLIIAGVNILYFLSLFPARQKMEEALNLSYEEEALL